MRKSGQAQRNPSAERTKAVMANLKKLRPAPGYIQNLNDYLMQYNALKDMRQTRLLNWSNLWLKIMFGMQKAEAGIDLATLTLADILEDDLPCRTLKKAVEAGLLPEVKNYERFVEEYGGG